MTSIKPIKFEGKEIIPLQFLKAVLPDPASLGPRTKGKTNIGCVVHGTKNGKPKTMYIYQICDHEECWKEVRSQAISYTTGVPAVTGAMMMLQGHWTGAGVFNVEELNPTPFLELLGKQGLPWQEVELPEVPAVLK
jgi:saccharopine dehydrogenase (NAD+, L-lysine-forming)